MTTNYYAGSLVNRVADYVTEKGMATLTDVSDQFPDRSKKQIHDALCNARCRRLLKVIMRGSFRGKRESVWAPEVSPMTPPTIKPEKPKPVASVWELGSPMHREWPPRFDGGRAFQLLGDWNAEEAAV